MCVLSFRSLWGSFASVVVIVMLSPSSFHRHRCLQSTLRAGAHRCEVGVVLLHCRVIPPTLCPIVILLVLVLAVSSPLHPVIVDRLHLRSHPTSSCSKAWGQVPCHPQQHGVGSAHYPRPCHQRMHPRSTPQAVAHGCVAWFIMPWEGGGRVISMTGR